ncbi:hypothetical protein ROZALSC1DRAFT_28075, partial [Rozella allomycis CSF55]
MTNEDPNNLKSKNVESFLEADWADLDKEEILDSQQERKLYTETYQDRNDVFKIKERNYNQQFDKLYMARLEALKPLVLSSAKAKWGNLNPQPNFVSKVLDVKNNELAVVVGAVYKDMPLKPNVLADLSKENNLGDIPPKKRFVGDNDKTLLEDISGRIVLNTSKLKDFLVTGIIIGALGIDAPDGTFEVLEICYPEMLDVVPRSFIPEDDVFVALVSGLNIGREDDVRLAALVNFLSGEIDSQKELSSKISRVIVAGNSVVKAVRMDDPTKPKRYGVDQTKIDMNPLITLDEILSSICENNCVDIMPGSNDPTGAALPQQSLHRFLFPNAGSFDSLKCVSNPHSFDFLGVQFLGTSGQNLEDILCYTEDQSSLEISDNILRWRHLCPTSPDTLWSYPFKDIDPFIITSRPHVYFVGNQSKFEYKKLDGDPKVVTAKEAVQVVKSNDRVYMHGIAAFPTVLAQELSLRAGELSNVEINHLHIEHDNPCSKSEYKNAFKTKNFFIGANQRKAVAEGISSLIPCFLSELPKLMRMGIRRPDVAFLNVSPPDKHGFCSLGVEVATAYAAVETAKVVVAQINPNVPRTHGHAFIPYKALDYAVHVDEPIHALEKKEPSEIEKQIGKHLAALIEDGATLQMGIGAIPNAVLSCLKDHKDLGIHTEMFSDGVMDLISRGVINNSKKTFFPDRIVTSFIMGSNDLYKFVDDNPEVMFMDVAIVNDPRIIGTNPKVTAINAAVEVDLTGQVCADSVGTRMISGVGGQVDFERGAALSPGGVPIICLPSTTKDGKSRIVPTLKVGAGVVTTRNHVHWVATEYGAVNLFGKDLFERARALINIAHPKHRADLER